MARKMRRVGSSTIMTVHSHAIARNGWEYFFLDPKPDTHKNMCALVMGFETEIGDVHIPEIAPHLMCYTKNMRDLMPAEGWEWID